MGNAFFGTPGRNVLPEPAQETKTKKVLAEPTQETKIVLPVLAQETEKALPELAKEDIELLKEGTRRTVRGSTLTFLQARVLENYLSYIYNTKRILYLLGNIKQ